MRGVQIYLPWQERPVHQEGQTFELRPGTSRGSVTGKARSVGFCRDGAGERLPQIFCRIAGDKTGGIGNGVTGGR